MEKNCIYADCAAQSRPRTAALEAAQKAMEVFGNPSGVHGRAKASARLIFEARMRTAKAVGASAAEICFTASATEAANMAVFSSACGGVKNGRRRMLIFSAEHHSVLRPASSTAQLLGLTVELIPCLPDGRADIEAFRRMCGDDVCLCALMTVNNETGVIQPVKELAAIAHSHGAQVFTDAAQAVGHIPVDVAELGCDYLSMSAHKFGGIPGAGALFCRNGLALQPLITGGGQERGHRSGTEALPAICAMGAAIEEAVASMDNENSIVAPLRDSLERKLSQHPRIHIVGGDAPRTSSILCVCVENADGEALALQLDRQGICASSGAACTTGENTASHVLSAMGIDSVLAKGSVRFSLDTAITQQDTDRMAQAVLKLAGE